MVPAWPAFSSTKVSSGAIRPQRAIWGKMHRASTDFRWLATTSGFDPAAELGIRALTVSTEDEPRSVYAWRTQGSGWMAIHAYPSRARDAAGRPGGLEKQLFYARSDSTTPAAVAAFFLLGYAAKADDSVWWDTWNDPNWEDYRYQLALSPEPEIAWNAASLQSRIDQGIAELRAKFSTTALASFYQDVLNSKAPSFLCVDTDAIGPEALAALLLPLNPVTVSRLSLIAGLPDSRLIPERLQNWAGVVSRFNSPTLPTPAGPNAQRMAESLLSGRPSGLAAAPVESVPAIVQPEATERTAQRLLDFLESKESRVLCGPELTVSDWRAIRSETQVNAIADRIRRLDADLDSDRTFADDPERRQARTDHLRVKYDQARCWLYAFAPGSKTLEQVPPRSGSPVAALRFTHLLAAEDWPWLHRYSEQDWALLLTRSMKQGQFEKRTRDWLTQFGPSAPAAIRQLIERYARS